MSESPYCVCLVTTPDEHSAATIARALVERELAACVNIIARVRSIYRWQGRIEDDGESLLVIKTRRERFDALAQAVRELHSYSTPEIIALPITAGSEAYLRWIDEVTSGKSAS